MTSRLLWAPLLLAQWGCTVTAVSGEEDARPRNSCTEQDSCGSGQICRDGLCQSLNGQLEAILVTATPSLDSGNIPHLTFVANVGNLADSNGVNNIAFPGAANVEGSLLYPDYETCYPSFVSDQPGTSILPSTDGTLPVTATLALRQRLLGLSQQIYYASTVTAPVSGYTFNLKVPSGEYDVYLVPPKRQTGDCVVPPQLYRGFPIGVKENSDPNRAYRFKLSAISKLDLRILWPESSPSLVGWTADIIEPLGGNAISTEVVLAEPVDSNKNLQYPVLLSYSTVSDATPPAVEAGGDLLRLRPPANVVAPSIFLERSGLGLLKNPGDPVELTIFSKLPSPVRVRGQMVRADDGRTVGGTLTLASSTIYGVDAGVFASYRTTVDITDEGVIDIELPPGEYRVQAVPLSPIGAAADSLSMLEADWVVPLDAPNQYGKVLELSRTSRITGQSRVPGAQVQATPSPRIVLPFERAFGVVPFAARSTGTLVDEEGQFLLQVDKVQTRLFDITVQAPDSLGFGWFVRPAQELTAENQDLGRLSLPNPSVLSGLALLEQDGGPVVLPHSAIRAYAYLDKNRRYTRDATQADALIQVAEARADQQGAFRLLLPASIDAPK